MLNEKHMFQSAAWLQLIRGGKADASCFPNYSKKTSLFHFNGSPRPSGSDVVPAPVTEHGWDRFWLA